MFFVNAQDIVVASFAGSIKPLGKFDSSTHNVNNDNFHKILHGNSIQKLTVFSTLFLFITQTTNVHISMKCGVTVACQLLGSAVSVWDSSVRLPINTIVDLVTTQSFPSQSTNTKKKHFIETEIMKPFDFSLLKYFSHYSSIVLQESVIVTTSPCLSLI